MVTQTTNYVTGDAAFAVDRRGVIVLWNREAEKLLGYRADDALGTRCWNLLAGEDIFDNRYCCERCPLREMASRHESIHSFPINFNTAYDGRQKFLLNSLLVYGDNGDERLLHLCHRPKENAEHTGHANEAARAVANHPRNALTHREVEVLALLGDGMTTHEIASVMCISEATVRNHIQHLLGKLHVHNRLEAVVIGQRLDLI